MKAAKAFAAAFLILLLAGSIWCSSSVRISGGISLVGTDKIDLSINVAKNQTVTYIVPGQIYSVKAIDGGGQEITPSVAFANGSSFIGLSMPSGHADVEITTDYLTSKTGNIWRFNSSSMFDTYFDSVDHRLVLPSSAVILRTNGIVQEQWGSKAVLWHYDNQSPNTPQNRFVTYAFTDTPDYTGIILAAVLALSALVLIYVFKFAGKRQGAPPARGKPAERQLLPGKGAMPAHGGLESNPAFITLEETDKEILRELRAQGGKTTQAHLLLRLHVPKATLSRHLASLERRELVRRSQKGIMKLVSIAPILEQAHGK